MGDRGAEIDMDELRRIIRSSSLTAAQIAEDAGISRVYMYQILGGRKNPSSEVVKKIVEVVTPSRPDSLLLGEIYNTPERAFRLWAVTQAHLLDDYGECRDVDERRRFLETLWVPMRMAWWTRGSARRVAECRDEMPPTSSQDQFGDWLTKRVQIEDRVACTIGLLCWREPEMMFALHRAMLPMAFDLGQHEGRVPPAVWEAAAPGN